MNDDLIERNRSAMFRFETCINTNDVAAVGIAGILQGIGAVNAVP